MPGFGRGMLPGVGPPVPPGRGMRSGRSPSRRGRGAGVAVSPSRGGRDVERSGRGVEPEPTPNGLFPTRGDFGPGFGACGRGGTTSPAADAAAGSDSAGR